MRNKKMYLNREAKSFALKCHISDMISIYLVIKKANVPSKSKGLIKVRGSS